MARDIAVEAQAAAMSKIEVGQSIAIGLTSHALDTGSPFPFVTLPDFEIRASKAREISKSEAIFWMPVVDERIRLEWESFANETAPVWLRTSLDQSGEKDSKTPTIPTRITDLERGVPVDGPFYSGDQPLSGKYGVLW